LSCSTPLKYKVTVSLGTWHRRLETDYVFIGSGFIIILSFHPFVFKHWQLEMESIAHDREQVILCFFSI